MDCNEADLPVVCELTNKSSWAEARDARAEKIRKVLAQQKARAKAKAAKAKAAEARAKAKANEVRMN